MPSKKITISESIIGVGALVLSVLDEPILIDDCWKKLNQKYVDNETLTKLCTFKKFILILDFLYLLNVININEDGEIHKIQT